MRRNNSFFKLDLLILAALNKGDQHGYGITAIIKSQTNDLFNLREGVLYPILYRLCEEGKISSRPGATVNGRNRVYYHIEEPGKEYMNELMLEYIKGTQGINEYLEWADCK